MQSALVSNLWDRSGRCAIKVNVARNLPHAPHTLKGNARATRSQHAHNNANNEIWTHAPRATMGEKVPPTTILRHSKRPAGRTLFHTGNFFNRLVREWTKTKQKINCPITRLIVHFAGLRLLSVQAVKQYSHQPGAKTQRLFSSARALPAVRNYNNRAHGGGCKFFCRLSRTGQLISSHSIYRRPGAITVRINIKSVSGFTPHGTICIPWSKSVAQEKAYHFGKNWVFTQMCLTLSVRFLTFQRRSVMWQEFESWSGNVVCHKL